MHPAEGERIHSMDALRASAMLLIVPVHAAILLAVNGRGGTWSTTLYWSLHLFRMPVFFAMSGFFLVLLLGRRGLGRTVRNRLTRILVPLAIGLVTLVPALVAASQLTDVSISGDGEVAGGSPFVFEPSFLWFLWYLLIVDACAVAALTLAPRLVAAGGRLMRAAIERPPLGVGLLALATTPLLVASPGWVVEPTTTTFAPELPALAYYALFFGLGATLSANRDLVRRVAANAWHWAACAVAAALPAGALFTLHNSGGAGESVPVHFAAMLIYAIAVWAALLTLIGLASRYLTRPRPRLRYLADCSYWIYLSHMPAMVLLIGLAGVLALGTAPTFALITVASTAFSLLTYALFVRYTAIGRLLNGPRQRPARRGAQPTPQRASAPAALSS